MREIATGCLRIVGWLDLVGGGVLAGIAWLGDTGIPIGVAWLVGGVAGWAACIVLAEMSDESRRIAHSIERADLQKYAATLEQRRGR